jgi:hypothetical protein
MRLQAALGDFQNGDEERRWPQIKTLIRDSASIKIKPVIRFNLGRFLTFVFDAARAIFLKYLLSNHDAEFDLRRPILLCWQCLTIQ